MISYSASKQSNMKEYDFELDEATMHSDLKSLLDDPERDMTDMFKLRDPLDDIEE